MRTEAPLGRVARKIPACRPRSPAEAVAHAEASDPAGGSSSAHETSISEHAAARTVADNTWGSHAGLFMRPPFADPLCSPDKIPCHGTGEIHNAFGDYRGM